MIKYDVYKRAEVYHRVATNARLYSHVWFYNERQKVWTPSHLRTIDMLLEVHHVLVARNVVFKDRVCSQ